MSKLIGTNPNQVPTNADLGTMAYMDYDSVAPVLIGGRRNLIINGDFQVWQRGTSFSGSGINWEYTADQWKTATYTTGTSMSKQHGVVDGIYSSYMSITNTNWLYADVENVYRFLDREVTISFYAKSPSSSTINISSYHRPESGATSVTEFGEISLTPTWTRYSVTATLAGLDGQTVTDSASTYTRFRFENPLSDGTMDLDITMVQVEYGAVATPYEHRSYGEELALCQRYFQTHYILGSGVVNSSNALFAYCSLPVTMRVSPTIAMKSGAYTNINAERSDVYDITNVALSHGVSSGSNELHDCTAFTVTVTTSGSRTLGEGVCIMCDRNNDAFEFDAEL